METKLYNSEVRELAKELVIKCINPNQAIKLAKELIDRLVEKGYYETEHPQELSDEDKKIKNILLREVRTTFGTKLHWKMMQEFNIDDYPIIADVIHCGRKSLLHIYGLGKKTLSKVDYFFDKNGLTWDMDLTKYGL